jgi:undecaprenyl-diphosphatase
MWHGNGIRVAHGRYQWYFLLNKFVRAESSLRSMISYRPDQSEGFSLSMKIGSRQYQWMRIALLPIVSVIVSLSVYVALELSEDVWFREGFSWDAPAMLLIHSFSTPFLDRLMILISHLGATPALILTGVITGWLLARRHFVDGLMLVISVGGAEVIVDVLKALFSRPRPAIFPPLAVETTYSFPSGHTMVAVALYGMLAVFAWRGRRFVWAVLCLLVIPLIALSRVYIGVHYPSDVLGAMSVGLLWVTCVATAHHFIAAFSHPRSNESMVSSTSSSSA